jgi:hypothetical protein
LNTREVGQVVDVEVKGDKGRKKVEDSDADEVREILTVVSDKVPALIKGLIGSVFSEDAARGMGKAAATYYRELKAGGMSEDMAVQMTKEYVGSFTRISEMLKSSSGPSFRIHKSGARESSEKEDEKD